MSGLRVELEVDAPTGCPVVETAAKVDAVASAVSWSDAGDRTVEQFALEGDSGGSVTATSGDSPDGVEPVFTHEQGAVYEFEREDGPCACERVEAAGVPVGDVRAVDGSLRLTLHLDEETDLGAILERVRDAAADVSVRSVARSTPDGDDPGHLVPVDRGRLTDRQLEVLETAHAMGYYDYPRGANASEVADALGICPSTLAEHLAAAQSKLLGDVLGETE